MMETAFEIKDDGLLPPAIYPLVVRLGRMPWPVHGKSPAVWPGFRCFWRNHCSLTAANSPAFLPLEQQLAAVSQQVSHVQIAVAVRVEQGT